MQQQQQDDDVRDVPGVGGIHAHGHQGGRGRECSEGVVCTCVSCV